MQLKKEKPERALQSCHLQPPVRADTSRRATRGKQQDGSPGGGWDRQWSSPFIVCFPQEGKGEAELQV